MRPARYFSIIQLSNARGKMFSSPDFFLRPLLSLRLCVLIHDTPKVGLYVTHHTVKIPIKPREFYHLYHTQQENRCVYRQ